MSEDEIVASSSSPPERGATRDAGCSPPPPSEELIHILVDSVRDYAIFLLDPDGRVVSWNAGAERIKGYTTEEILGKHFSLFYPPTEIARGTPPKNLDIAATDGQYHAEGWRIRKDGNQFWAEVTITALRDQTRRLVGFGKVTRDLTERKRAEEELRRSEVRFRLLVEGVVDYAIFMLDPTGHITSWNLGAERIKGYTEAEVLGKHFSIFYPDEEIRHGKPVDELATATAEGRFEDEGWRVRSDGTRFWANVVITALRDATGALVGFGKVTRDLTERKRREEERAARAVAEAARSAAEEHTARMEEILHVIAHDLRQPLTAIGAHSQLLSRALLGRRHDQARQRAETIASTSRRMDALLTDLIESVRLESGQVQVEPRVVALGEFLRDLARRYAAAIPAERLRLEVPETTVLADPPHLERIVANLVSNALKYSPPETVVCVRADEHPEEVVVRVVDQGIGIAPDDLPRVFERGFRTAEARAQGEGSGLGLFIVRELVRAHRGRIWVESQSNRGSTFYVALPRPKE